MKRIVLLSCGVETLAFFSSRLAECFSALGYEVTQLPVTDDLPAFALLEKFALAGETVFITFNFHGISQEACFYNDRLSLCWDAFDIPCVNIIVDHPFYYYEELKHLPKRCLQVCIDFDHAAYLKRFYPSLPAGPVLPLAGSACCPSPTPIKTRRTPVVFTGNYTPPADFEPYITRLGAEYEQFYRAMLADLAAAPEQSMDAVFERHLRAAMPQLSDADYPLAMSKLIFIDLSMRFYFRGEAIRTLVDAGIPVRAVGAGWDRLPVRRPEKLSFTGFVDSAACLRELGGARLSLNVLPWFRQGSHDRIYNSMLCGAAVLTDGNAYLHKLYPDGGCLSFYELSALDALADQAGGLLADEARLETLAAAGYEHASKEHTWEAYAKALERLFLTLP